LFKFANSKVEASVENSIWSIACPGSNLLLSNKWVHSNIQRKALLDSFTSFVSNARATEYDKYSWPSNAECS